MVYRSKRSKFSRGSLCALVIAFYYVLNTNYVVYQLSFEELALIYIYIYILIYIYTQCLALFLSHIVMLPQPYVKLLLNYFFNINLHSIHHYDKAQNIFVTTLQMY